MSCCDWRELSEIPEVCEEVVEDDMGPEAAGQASDKFQGTTWVITGTLSQPREEIAELIRSHSGKVSSSVSAKTTYLLAGEEAGSKLDKATKLGVKVLTEPEFHTLLTSA